MRRLLQVSTVSCLTLAASSLTGFAQTSPPQNLLPAVADRAVVTPSGLSFQHRDGVAAPTAGNYSNTTPGTKWTLTDGGLAWIATSTSIGNRGTQVFSEVDLNSERAILLSSFDSHPPTPVWQDTSALATEFRVVASADATDTHVTTHQIVLGGNMQTRQAVLTKYGSHSPTADWSYTFAPVINAGSTVGISRDGTVIVAAIYNDPLSQVEVAVFSPASNVPLSYTILPAGVNGYLRGFDLSADGSTLYYSAGVTANIFDVATASVVFSTNIGASFDSHSISGDGSVFAYGNFNQISIWERSGPVYTNTFTRIVGGACYGAIIDISDDSSTIAYGFTFYDQYLKTQVEALDVATKAVTMSHIATGAGGAQNIIADVAISADGSRFAVGRWGDAAGLVNEVDVYDRNNSTPILSSNLPGSVFSVDISADGQRVVAGSKAVHANTFGNGGRIDLLDVGNEDFALRTVPHVGALLSFDLYGQPNKTSILLQSLAEAPTPTVFPGVGTLYIRRNTMVFLPHGTTDGTGFATGTLQLGSNPALIGTSLYYQGYTVGPRKLTNDWVKATILP